MALLVILLLLVLALSVLLVVPRRFDRPPLQDLDPSIDADELRDAEDELDQLSSDVTPEEADDHLPDWGPGAPRRHRNP